MNANLIVTPSRLEVDVETAVSEFDRWNAMIVSCIVLTGFFVTGLFLVWLTGGGEATAGFSGHDDPGKIKIKEWPDEELPTGLANDFAEIGAQDLPELDFPLLATAIEPLTEAVSTVQARYNDFNGYAITDGRGVGPGIGIMGPGPLRDTGPIAEYKRWVIKYESDNVDEYARQLSFFHIDIGVVRQSTNEIKRIHDPGVVPEVIASNRQNETKTLRFMHKKRKMQRWDELLAKRENVSMEDSFTCQFYPESTRQLIRQAELAAITAAGKTITDVRSTKLKLEPQGSEFEFVVEEIVYFESD